VLYANNGSLCNFLKNYSQDRQGMVKMVSTFLLKYIGKQRLFVVSIFCTIFVLGLFIYKDYGLSVDEFTERNTGIVSLKYIENFFSIDIFHTDPWLASDGDKPLHEYDDRFYGVAFQVPVLVLERVFGLKDTKKIFLFRHLMNFFVFFVGLCFFYRLVKKRFADWRLGLLGVFLLVCTPRIFAESFYNCKDIVLMSVMIIAVYASINFISKPSIVNLCYLAFISAITVDIRIVGIIIPVATVALYAIVNLRNFGFTKKTPYYLLGYIGLLLIFVIMFWPVLWSSPYENFIAAYNKMSKYPWTGLVLYLGEYITASALPWHYIPVWIAVTTPIMYLVLFVIGLVATAMRLVKIRLCFWNDIHDVQDVYFLGLVVVPILAIIFLKSTVYDGWRQLYFIYPYIIILVVMGFSKFMSVCLRKRYIAFFAFCCIAIFQLALINWMVKYHPHQNVYFNLLAGRELNKHFEMDYWGLSNRPALEYLVRYDKNDPIKLWDSGCSFVDITRLILEPRDLFRVKVVSDINDADYVITNYRCSNHDFDDDSGKELLYKLTIDTTRIMSLYKINK
jgi:hypothetical protein